MTAAQKMEQSQKIISLILESIDAGFHTLNDIKQNLAIPSLTDGGLRYYLYLLIDEQKIENRPNLRDMRIALYTRREVFV